MTKTDQINTLASTHRHYLYTTGDQSIVGFGLNLITTFVALYETQSATVVAERLCVAQPLVSYALARFKERFDDALFVRNRQGMQPTRSVTQLYEGSRKASRSTNDAVPEARKLSPLTSKRRFRLTLLNLGEAVLLPRALERLNQMAPNIELDIVPLETDQVAIWLNDGYIDAAICSQILSGVGITHQRLMNEQYCCLVDDAHPRIGTQMNMQQFLAGPHAIIIRTSGHGTIEDVLKKMAVEHRVWLRIPHLSMLSKITPGTEMITTLSYRITWSFCEFSGDKPSRVVDLPFEVPFFEVTLYWHL